MIALTRIARLATRAGLDADTRTAIEDLAADVLASPILCDETRSALAALAECSRGAAIATIRARESEPRLAEVLGTRTALWHVMLALLQLPAADARHRRADIDHDVSSATWRDLGSWCEQFRARFGILGFSLDILDWAQSYLRGGLLRVGALQWELRSFERPIHAFRDVRSGELRYVATPGAWFGRGGAREATSTDPDARVASGSFGDTAVEAHPVDVRRGVVELERFVRLDRSAWQEVHGPATQVLELHVPDATGLDVGAILRSYRAAERVFARLAPGCAPRGLYGEAWLLDPQVRDLLPRHAGIAGMQRACALFPGRILEAKTIRRCFGPAATRLSAVAAPPERLTGLQRALSAFLADPSRELLARGGLVVMEQLDALERSSGIAP